MLATISYHQVRARVSWKHCDAGYDGITSAGCIQRIWGLTSCDIFERQFVMQRILRCSDARSVETGLSAHQKRTGPFKLARIANSPRQA